MVSAYPGLFYPGQAYPGHIDTVIPKPPVHASDTDWGSWWLSHDGTWIRRETRVVAWTSGPVPAAHLLTDTSGLLTTEAGDRLTT